MVAVAALAAATPRARAGEGFAVQLKAGLTTLGVSAGGTSGYNPTGGGNGGLGLELRPEIHYEVGDINTAFGLFYEGHLGSNIGAYPLSRFGVSVYYYLVGRPISIETNEAGVTFTQNHIAPFVTGQMAYTSVSVTDQSTLSITGHSTSFNGEALAYMLGAGLELPMGGSTTLVLEMLYENILAGGTATSVGTQSGSGLTYSTFGGLMGLSFHP